MLVLKSLAPAIYRSIVSSILILSAASAFQCPATAADGPDFYREVRPILAKACFHCHGPDEETREAGLRLDIESGLFGKVGDRTVVLKGDADHSELIRRILSNNPDEQMPPADSGRTLTDQQKQTLVQWINQGAAWAEHWAFIPPQRPAVPEVRADAGSAAEQWTHNPVDRFLLYKQVAAGVKPSPRADSDVLVRRVFLDLIGLPPTIEEANHWIAKLDADSLGAKVPSNTNGDHAWTELVDHLLSRPEYGERWARTWLDLARYADTNGYEKDRPRSIWPYRDWVIQALNDDMSFDQFTVEQLAGDLLPNATVSQKIATGFHRNTMLNEEGGIDPLEFRFHAMTDRVATTGTTWLGLTVGCAQCHTHKYDPLTHVDYYQMMAFLNNADEPSLALPSDDLQQQSKLNQQKAATLLEQLPTHWPVNSFEPLPASITEATSDGGEELHVTSPSSVTIKGAIPAKTTYVIDFASDNLASVHAIRLEALSSDGKKGPGRAENGNFVLSEVQISLVSTINNPDGAVSLDEVTIPIVSVTASVEQKNYPASASIDGNSNTGWAVDGGKGVPPQASATFTIDRKSLEETLAKVSAAKSESKLRVRLVQTHGAAHFLSSFQLSLGQEMTPAQSTAKRAELVQEKFAEWLNEQRQKTVVWSAMVPQSVSSNMPHLTILDDHSVLASGDTTKQDRYELELAPMNRPITAIQLEALPDERLPGNGPGTTYYEGSLGDFYLNELSAFAGDQKLIFTTASESYTKNKFGNTPTSAALTLDGDVQTGWSVAEGEGQRHTAVYLLKQPIPVNTAVRIQMIFGRHFASSLGRFRFSACHTESQPVARSLSEADEQLLARDDQTLAPSERTRLFHAFLLQAPELSGPASKIRQLLQPPEPNTTLVLNERPVENPRPTFRHHRGEYLQTREAVAAATPESLHAWPNELPRNRLGFAKWLVHRSNPLTARVIVNRQWAALFGRGIVVTVDDFGIQGTAPSHPELLDWLAVTWMDDDHWSLKSLHRRLVMTEVYRQSSVRPEPAPAQDPDNTLLTWTPRFRLDAEIVRDSIVQAAGVLSKKQGGPPVRPLQPPGITEVAFGRPGWNVSSGEDRYRRSIYTFIKRTAPFAMITTFDGPSGEACIARRNRSNTPLQALTLLNDPMFVDLAQASGRNLVQLSNADDKTRVVHLFRSLLTRSPDENEVAALLEFVARHRKTFSTDSTLAKQMAGEGAAAQSPDAAGSQTVEVATWAAVSRAVFALDEVVMRP